MGWFKDSFFPVLTDEERARRTQLFRVLVIVQGVAALLIAASGVLDSLEAPGNIPVVVGLSFLAIAMTVAGYLLARRGAVRAGGILLVVGMLVILGYFLAFYGTRGSIPFFFIWPILISSIVLEPAYALVVVLIATGLMGGFSYGQFTQALPIPLFRRAGPAGVGQYVSFTVEVIIVYWAASLFNWMISRSLRQTAERFRLQAEETVEREQALQKTTLELQQALAEREEKAAEVQRALDEVRQAHEDQARLLEAIRAMSTPVVPVRQGVLVMPLVGIIDAGRAQHILQTLLDAVERERARVVLLDITGVPVVDAAVAQALLQSARSVQLLGAEAVLVGVSPQVAETVVSLGVDLADLVTRADLQSGLEYAFHQAERRADKQPVLW